MKPRPPGSTRTDTRFSSSTLFRSQGSDSIRTRYRYYDTKAVNHDATAKAAPAIRSPAQEIEQAVIAELAAMLADPHQLIERMRLDLPPGDRKSTRLNSSH